MNVTNVVCLVVIISIGTVCNAFALYFILQKQTTTTNKDRIVALLCAINFLQNIGFAIELHSAITGKVSDKVCPVEGFLITSLSYSSIGYFLALAIERYLAILHPFKYVRWVNKYPTKLWLILPSVYGFILALPPLLGWSRYGKLRPTSTYCGFGFKSAGIQSYFMFVVILAFIVPVILTSACFVRILLELRKSVIETKRRYGNKASITTQSTRNVQDHSISCLLTALVYFVSWIPYSVVCFINYTNGNVSLLFEVVSMYMSKSVIVSSPVVFCLVERNFRRFIWTRMCRRKGNRVAPAKELAKELGLQRHSMQTSRVTSSS